MNKLSEEEIIKIMEDMAKYTYCTEVSKCKGAIQGLLDLYQKEKEKNKKLEEIKKALETMFNVADEVEKGWRDKIKAKIEELNKEMLKENNSLAQFYKLKYCYDVLQELLEEK